MSSVLFKEIFELLEVQSRRLEAVLTLVSRPATALQVEKIIRLARLLIRIGLYRQVK
jgi:hypothetical protein